MVLREWVMVGFRLSNLRENWGERVSRRVRRDGLGFRMGASRDWDGDWTSAGRMGDRRKCRLT